MGIENLFFDSVHHKRRICAVYGILNRLNFKIYIGGTTCLAHRKSVHKSQIKNGVHCNAVLTEEIRLNPSYFELVLIEEIKDSKILKEREEFWVQFYKSYLPDNGYNLTPSGYSKGQAFTMQHMFEMASKVKGKKLPTRSDSWSKNLSLSLSKRPVIQCDLHGNEMRKFISASEASRVVVGVDWDNSIRQALKGKQSTARGFIWKYATA